MPRGKAVIYGPSRHPFVARRWCPPHQIWRPLAITRLFAADRRAGDMAPRRLSPTARLRASIGMRHSVHVMPAHPSTTVRTWNNFIDGHWVPSRSGRHVENRNPADTSDLIGLFQESTPEDATDALMAAKRAYPAWRLTPAPRRAEILFRAAEILAQRKE